MKKIALMLAFVLLFTVCGCGKKNEMGDDVVAVVGDTEISKAEFEFYLTSIKSQMNSTELQTDEDWQTHEIEGVKAIELAKERALESAAENIAYIKVAEYFGIELTQDDKMKVEQVLSMTIQQAGGTENYKNMLSTYGVSEAFYRGLCESMVYSEKLAEKALQDKPLSEEEENAIFEELSMESKFNAKHILFSTVDDMRQPLSDEVAEQKRIEAEETYNKILQGADYDTLMNQLSEDPGLETNPDGYIFGEGEMVSEFEDGVKAIGFGEVALVKSSLGYHIIKRLPIDKEMLIDEIKMTAMARRLEEAMPGWRKDAGIEVKKNDKVLDSIL